MTTKDKKTKPGSPGEVLNYKRKATKQKLKSINNERKNIQDKKKETGHAAQPAV